MNAIAEGSLKPLEPILPSSYIENSSRTGSVASLLTPSFKNLLSSSTVSCDDRSLSSSFNAIDSPCTAAINGLVNNVGSPASDDKNNA